MCRLHDFSALTVGHYSYTLNELKNNNNNNNVFILHIFQGKKCVFVKYKNLQLFEIINFILFNIVWPKGGSKLL